MTKTPTEHQLHKAGILIRDRKLAAKNCRTRIEYQVVDGRRIVSRHIMFNDALKAAQILLAEGSSR